MRKTLGVCLLVLLLSGSTSAGIMPNGAGEQPPPAQPTSAAPEPAADGEIPNDATVTLTQAVLTVLASLLP